MRAEPKLHLAIFAGLFATGGAVCAKLAASNWALILKVALLGAMVISNTIGCTLFVRAMASSRSSLPATVLSSGVNYFCSALMGRLIFGEGTSRSWMLGTTFVLLGLVLICYSQVDAKSKRKEEKDEEEKERLLEERKRQ